MKITQSLVELLNARLKDLMFEVSLSNAIELAEDMALDGSEQMKQSLLNQMSVTFDKPIADVEEMRQALEEVKNQLEATVQLDYYAEKFRGIGATDSMIGESVKSNRR
jgi:ribosomal 50S subunit-associated protein YjgA (DUF615 family)